MKTINAIIAIGLTITLFNCASSSKEEKSMAEQATPDISASNADKVDGGAAENSNAFISSSAAHDNPKDSTHQFIRTADLKFKVKNVIRSTYDIENITNKNGGFVTYTNLFSHIDYTNQFKISKDSSLEITYFTVNNEMTIRVPRAKLDTTLRDIARNIDFLDYRIIKAEDVALKLLSNQLTQNRVAKNETRLTSAIDSKGKKLEETTQAEELLINKKEQADNAKISSLSLRDQIEFSTLVINLYQHQEQKHTKLASVKEIKDYEPSFGTKLIDSTAFGWQVLQGVILTIIKLWAVILLGIFIYVIIKKIRNKRNNIK